MINKYEEADKFRRDIVMKIFPKIQMVETEMSARCDLSGSTINGDWYMEIKYRPDLKQWGFLFIKLKA